MADDRKERRKTNKNGKRDETGATSVGFVMQPLILKIGFEFGRVAAEVGRQLKGKPLTVKNVAKAVMKVVSRELTTARVA